MKKNVLTQILIKEEEEIWKPVKRKHVQKNHILSKLTEITELVCSLKLTYFHEGFLKII